jgi:potassium-dependent mechanosensitive channel
MTLANEFEPPRRPARLGWLLAACGLLAMPAHGQTIPGLGGSTAQRAEPAEPAVEAPARQPAAFAAERIPAQMEHSRELARRATEAARPHADIDSFRTQMTVMAEQIERLGNPAVQGELSRTDLRSLEQSAEQVAGLRRAINAMQATLGRRAAELGGWREELSVTLRSWNLTEEEVEKRELSVELLSGSKLVQTTLRDAAKRLGERQDEILALQTTLGGWLSVVDEHQVTLDAELAEARLELFRPEQPPLWQAEPSSMVLAASREAWLQDLDTLRSYLDTRHANAWVHGVLLVFLLGAFAMLSRKVHRWSEGKPDLARALAVFRHPLAAALVLAILIAPWLYPDAPGVLREVLGLLLILPLLRVLPLIVPSSLRSAVYLLAGLYLLMRLNGLLGVGTALERYGLLLLGGAAAGTVGWIFRPSGPAAQLDGGRLWRTVRLLARLGLILLAVALLANIGGLVSLSGLLTNAVISSAFVAVVLFAGIVVTRAMILALLQTELLQHLNIVRWHSADIDQWIMRILPLAAVLAWVMTTTRLFRIEGMIWGFLSTALFAEASIGTIQISLADILSFALAIWLGLLISRFLRFELSVDVYPRVTLPRGVAATISMLVNYLVLGIAFTLAIAAAGIQLDRFALIVGALSVGIGFGLQNIVNNFISGLILAFERPVQTGDTVEFNAMFGKVTRIGVRSSTVRTFDGAEVIVPNANLISNEVTNWTLSDMRRRMEVLVGVAYGTNPRHVIELLLNVARGQDRLLDNPGPSAFFMGFGDNSLNFSLRAWTDDFDDFLSIKSDLTLAVHDAIYAAGIEIPFPQRDLHLRSIDAAALGRLGPPQSPAPGASVSSDASGSGSSSGSGAGSSSGSGAGSSAGASGGESS